MTSSCEAAAVISQERPRCGHGYAAQARVPKFHLLAAGAANNDPNDAGPGGSPRYVRPPSPWSALRSRGVMKPLVQVPPAAGLGDGEGLRAGCRPSWGGDFDVSASRSSGHGRDDPGGLV